MRNIVVIHATHTRNKLQIKLTTSKQQGRQQCHRFIFKQQYHNSIKYQNHQRAHNSTGQSHTEGRYAKNFHTQRHLPHKKRLFVQPQMTATPCKRVFISKQITRIQCGHKWMEHHVSGYHCMKAFVPKMQKRIHTYCANAQHKPKQNDEYDFNMLFKIGNGFDDTKILCFKNNSKKILSFAFFISTNNIQSFFEAHRLSLSSSVFPLFATSPRRGGCGLFTTIGASFHRLSLSSSFLRHTHCLILTSKSIRRGGQRANTSFSSL